MTKLEEMWDALAKWQDKADEQGHGKTWAEMCRLRTVAAAEASRADSRAAYTAASAAADAIYAATWVLCAADNAVYAAASATRNAIYAKYYAKKVIEAINKAIEEQEKQND